MTTYTETGSEGSIETEEAIKRSISHNEKVCVKCEDPAALADWIDTEYDDVDHATIDGGAVDIWGQRSGEDFRLLLTKSE